MKFLTFLTMKECKDSYVEDCVVESHGEVDKDQGRYKAGRAGEERWVWIKSAGK